MDEFRKEIKEMITDIRDRVVIQNGRVGKLEKWQSFTQGGLVILGILVSPVIVKVVLLIMDGIF